MMSQSERQSAAGAILRVIPKVMRVLASEIRQQPGGLAPAHFRVMLMLTKQPRSLSDLAASQSVSLATMSKSISVLVDRGWVNRRRDLHDRRKLALEITDEGKVALREVHMRAEAHFQELLAGVNETHCREIQRGLELLNDVFSADLETETPFRKEAE